MERVCALRRPARVTRAWLDWSRPLDTSVPGCTVVLTRGDPAGWTGHASFYLRTQGDPILLLGSKQRDGVCENSYPPGPVPGYRWPSGTKLR